MAKYWIEELTSIDVEADIASEFRYRKVKLNKDDLYIFVSQSGETADTYAALEKCKKRLTEIYGEDWDEHVKLKDHFRSKKPYYIWVLLISHKQQWNEKKK